MNTKRRHIITLITDFHLCDHYLAGMKGKILSDNPDSIIIDVVHQVPIDDISKAAFHLSGVKNHFPSGTIHVISVNNHYHKDPKYLVFEREGHFFIGPDNGVFSLVFEDFIHQDVYQIELEGISVFDATSHYTNGVAFISQNLPLEEIGPLIKEPYVLTPLQPVSSFYQLRVLITHIDGFGNAITNLSFEAFEKIREGRKFRLYYNPHDPVTCISASYAHVEYGEPLLYFNQDGLLELSVNMGNAAQLLNLKTGDTLQIDFIP